MPQLYINARTLVTASGVRHLSPEMGHTPPLAKVLATTAKLSHVISNEHNYEKVIDEFGAKDEFNFTCE